MRDVGWCMVTNEEAYLCVWNEFENVMTGNANAAVAIENIRKMKCIVQMLGCVMNSDETWLWRGWLMLP